MGAASLASVIASAAAAPAPKQTSPEVGDWVEANFPFYSTVLDARKAGAGFPKNNLTPRGIVLNLGRDCWVCFDPDLLRVSAVWRGEGVTPKALAAGSYHDGGRKTPGGQTPAPEPAGNVWLANGIYPGWQVGTQVALDDPREPAPSPEEIGRGPIAESLGRFSALHLAGETVVLEYTVAATTVREWSAASEHAGQPVIERHFSVGPSTQPLTLVLGAKSSDAAVALGLAAGAEAELAEEKGISVVRVRPHSAPITFAVAAVQRGPAPIIAPRTPPSGASIRRWPQEVTTTIKRSPARDAYVVDHIALPLDNPWRRAVRPGDIQFFKDGTGVTITLDGDVWLVRGLNDPSGAVRWRRFASGLHEPMTIALRDEQIYAFDKNGIWRLRDTNNDGEADVHELFSNAFGQTADMREFPSQIRLAPKGEFVIAKGGQQATYEGKHNGSVLRISSDGRRSEVLGYGFRQPNIGVNVRTGLVTSSDQQGQYIPSTPLHIVRDRQFYGFLAPFKPKEVYPSPPAEPLTWIPHAINASAISQVWLFDAKLGPLDDSLVHIGFNKPEVFRVIFNERGSRPQASVVSITRAFEFPPLNGSVNPADGNLYIAGFQILGWGNIIDVGAGMGRVRYTGAPVTLPREVIPMDQGVLLRFDVALDPQKARDPASYSLQSWSYKRTYKYGSPQYKADGTPGQDAHPASSAYLSLDGRSVLVGVPAMKPVMQLRIGWSLATRAGIGVEENAYTTPYELAKFDPKAEGFGDIKVDLSPRSVIAQAGGPVTLEEGKRLSQLFACVACHADEQNPAIPKSGPPWKGLYGAQRSVFVAGKPAKVPADDAYVRESILDPTAKVAAGFEKGEYAMPSFAGVLNDSQVDSLVLYIKSLR
jgi:glucose/arabinose dehydrogenase/mono/diheme cytochrome c family protein